MDPLATAQYALAPALASALLHSLWQDALLGLAASLVLRAMGRSSASMRHAVGMAFLAAMLLVPAAQFVLFLQSAGTSPYEGLLPIMTSPRLDAAANLFVQESSPLAALVVLAWLAGVALMGLCHVAGLRAVAAMERGPFQALPPAWQQRVDELRRGLGIARVVAVRVTEEVLTPCAARLLRPLIWVPLSLLLHAPADQLEVLLAHELAHIARRDWLWNGLQCATEVLLFFHPAVWWLGRRIRQEREHACDDLAVAACGNPIALAEALAALEHERHAGSPLVLAARGGSLLHRITRLLSGPPTPGRWGAFAMLGALALAGALLAVQVALTGGRWPDLMVRASTEGPLGPGDFREIRANGLDRLRFYRASLDAQGRLSEVYEEDGRAHAIDAGVRRWLDEVSRMSLPPPSPQEPAVPVIPEVGTLVGLIAARPEVVARLGTPVVATSRPIDGAVRMTDAVGDADIRIELSGPRGSAKVAVKADLRDGVWTLHRVKVR